jgi:hypothetical protein
MKIYSPTSIIFPSGVALTVEWSVSDHLATFLKGKIYILLIVYIYCMLVREI